MVYDPVFLKHDTGSHPENALRIRKVMETLEHYGIKDRMREIKPVQANTEQLTAFHTQSYIDRIAKLCESGGGRPDEDTVVSKDSFQSAVMAAGAVITGIDKVMSREVDSAFAMVRPPGHHALQAKSMGFCLFNNVVIGAQHARKKHGLERIMIIDWDFHHGNGTADAFYDTDSVLYFSTHMQASWPGTGWVSHVGTGRGQGYTINIPLAKGTGDPGFYMVFNQLLLPVIRQYKPELIIVSAGFDAHFADPLGGLEVTCAGFARMADIIKKAAEEVCAGRVVIALEGGYNLEVIGHAVSAVLNEFGEYGINIEEPVPQPPPFVKPTMRIPLDEAMRIHGQYWELG